MDTVTSADGTTVAFDRIGSGASVILVGNARIGCARGGRPSRRRG
jgi:hypothetical protein